MNMIFKRKLPVPQEVKETYPLDEKLALIKNKIKNFKFLILLESVNNFV